jgi:aminoglycoside phosphotransferase (APT) family kinase protein
VEGIEPLSASEVREMLGGLGLGLHAAAAEIELNEEHSNSLAEVRFPSGRALIVKRARYAEMAGRFHTSREASRLLRERTDLAVPRYLGAPRQEGDLPVLMYWRISHPTLEHSWNELPPDARDRALEGCGHLLRRMHAVELSGHGPLLRAMEQGRPLLRFLEDDLTTRLRPAVQWSWPAQVRSLDALCTAFRHVLSTRVEPTPVLVHNDLFTANVLCRRDGDGVRCVGVLDFEDCFAGPAEADLAKTEVLHGPLFGRCLHPRWFHCVLDGYGTEPDAVLVALFRAYHLLNMGYHATVSGLAAHAEEVGEAVARELRRWEQGARHRDVLG